jgi:hypothetical protein
MFMNTTKRYVTALIFIASLSLPQRISPAPIPGASYVIFDPIHLREAFYTYDGNLIERLRINGENTLDPNAPKPQPTHYIIRTENDGAQEASHITFYDKNNNALKTFRYNPQSQIISISSLRTHEWVTYQFHESNPGEIDQTFPLDLSNIQMAPRAPRERTCLLL